MQEWYICKDCKQIVDIPADSLIEMIHSRNMFMYLDFEHVNCPNKQKEEAPRSEGP